MTEHTPHLLDMLLGSVQSLTPLIRAHVEEAERNRRLSPPVVAALRDAQLFRLYVPQTLGGLEVPPQVLYRAVEEIARLDGATGWCTFIGAVASLFGAFLPDAVAEEMFGADPGGLVAPPPAAAAVRQGWRMPSGSNDRSRGCRSRAHARPSRAARPRPAARRTERCSWPSARQPPPRWAETGERDYPDPRGCRCRA